MCVCVCVQVCINNLFVPIYSKQVLGKVPEQRVNVVEIRISE